jgi:hypothetical protein
MTGGRSQRARIRRPNPWPGLARSLAGIVERVAGGLGVTGSVAAELYKPLVYDEGSFFVSHRDTEKMDGMFATLVVVLPSHYTGGDLLLRHQDREVVFDLHCPDPSQAAFAAFYADCVHEVLPVTSGCRLTLIYTLSRREPGDPPRPPSYAIEGEQLTALLRHWAEDDDRTDGRPDKLIFPLEHAYSQASLSFAALKGADAARAATLLAAAQAADCDLYLALLSLDESRSAEYAGNRITTSFRQRHGRECSLHSWWLEYCWAPRRAHLVFAYDRAFHLLCRTVAQRALAFSSSPFLRSEGVCFVSRCRGMGRASG